MWVMVAGPYSAPDPSGRQANFAALQRAAMAVWRMGHVPVVGLSNGLPMVTPAGQDLHLSALDEATYRLVNDYGLALAERCDGVLSIGRSRGADAEVEAIGAAGGFVVSSIEDLAALGLSRPGDAPRRITPG